MDKNLRERFVNCVDDLVDFETVYSAAKSDDNIHSLEITRVELNSLWDQIKKAYLDCRDRIPEKDETPIDKTKLRNSYKQALETYKRCLSSLNGEILALNEQQDQEKQERISMTQQRDTNDFSPALRLPPCDTDVFKGGYREWPTFRDLFSAIYINNSKLSKVEKLFHLTQKTAGEAREIISNVPLTHEGFDIAWRNLVHRYENKRMQVNEQLRALFNLPSVSVDNASTIQKLQRTIGSCTQTLQTLEVETGGWDPILVYLVSTKLPRIFLEEFESSLADCSSLPSWNQLDVFLTHKFKTLESVGNIKPQYSRYNQPRSEDDKREKRVNSFQTNVNPNFKNTGSRPSNNTQSHYNAQNNKPVCQLCKSNHSLRECPQFLERSINDRINIVKTSHLCYNCLSSDHGVRECKSRFSCRECSQRHHSLIHKGNQSQYPTTGTHQRGGARPSTSAAALNTLVQPGRQEARPSTSATDPTTLAQPVSEYARPSTSAAASTTLVQPSVSPNIQSTPCLEAPCSTTLTLQEIRPTPQPKETLLFTAIVQIKSRGHRYDARAIIDPGSQSTFISEKIRNKLQLPTVKNLIHVTGLSDAVSETSTKACVFNLCSRVNPSFELEVWAPVLKTLPSHLPTHYLRQNQFGDFAHLSLADPRFFESRPVDMLIGLDIGPLIFTKGGTMKSFGSLIAQDTVFGWIIGGPITEDPKSDRQITLYSASSLEKIITRFWEVEETPKKVLRSAEDIYCENNYKNTTRRNEAGRYIVTLPFKSCSEIGSSRNIALAQFHRMEKKLSKTPDIKAHYDAAILEYLELGHMRKVDPNSVYKTPHYYLPHHAVIKPDRVTTKLRVVFNASSPTSNKKSLNDILHTGPILQQDLVVQVLNWRFFKYVFNADVTKMYRQILVDPNQTAFQRILFRKSENHPIEDYELLTVTFGINCAPFLAIRTLLQLAEDVKDSHPLGSRIIKENLYVDDVLAGGHSIEEATAARKELASALESAGFELRKWASNDTRLLKDLNEDMLLPIDWLNISEASSTKTLGIRWNISGDNFTFTAPTVEERQMTPYQRYETVERRSYCRNCLARSHLAPDCPVVTACRTCDYRHHTMLHGAPQLRKTYGSYSPPPMEIANPRQLAIEPANQMPIVQGPPPVEIPYSRATVFVPTAMVELAPEEQDDWAGVRVLLCQASTITRIAAATVTRLGIPTRERRGHRLATIRLRSRHASRRTMYTIRAVVTRDLPRRPYSDPIIPDPTSSLRSLSLADADPRGNEPIDVEVGADAYAHLRRSGVVQPGLGAVFAQETDWGYVFVGPVTSQARNQD
ncbi:uncharacterized protein LOC131997037 [Stomoxys calcitrans]|uniref:uncharacterized protein LOC131997037 n=1 Tax=Stomoxys calcitrans TaxID=35570 RepID=UPI0027E37EEA|nr:uncharacterized protein LOC131997037 [Stomoxys calcitrans]